MNKNRLIKISKYLSKHLRHQPERLGLKLAPGGWVKVDELLITCAKNAFPISRSELNEVVAKNDKQRFSFDVTGNLIRANQGHSVEIDLQLELAIPPNVLFHGTGHKAVDLIQQYGLNKMSRHHVHLSADIETARKVGARHGHPVIFAIDAAAMQQAGYTFYCSDNNVWLVDSVPTDYLHRI
ncbi:RNA 2'-phosphotransferase [Gloeocapsopsis crepidinum LEGE 06123]|uniref:Probable RNA 2'-phosphotransferase n=1 Tax=Gloeocapsopsis crepidinum LEGE 06123 TaxID=588587 RepID=A0ABR9UP14_9CHRO|nr:RNA 2'-phosphotransferase [Gloeocapsopsis crepidinum]MBE9190024.1 RNA 2'-phosphotransferase [Gloeocapsopsis crepidinum LEGE 06123]